MSFRNMDIRRRHRLLRNPPDQLGWTGHIYRAAGMAADAGLLRVRPRPLCTGLLVRIAGHDSRSGLGYLWTRWGLRRLGPKTVLVISGSAAVLVFLGLALAQGQVWLSWLWVFLYALTILSCLTTGYTLVAAAGRQDNMAMTVGMQNIIQFVGAMIAVAVILNVLVPGPDGFIPQATFAGI